MESVGGITIRNYFLNIEANWDSNRNSNYGEDVNLKWLIILFNYLIYLINEPLLNNI